MTDDLEAIGELEAPCLFDQLVQLDASTREAVLRGPASSMRLRLEQLLSAAHGPSLLDTGAARVAPEILSGVARSEQDAVAMPDRVGAAG